MLRRLHKDQPDSFAFTPANQAWAEAQITKFPEGREASAIIPLLWRAQEQEGWLSRPAIEAVAGMLGLAYIRALEVATFYFMFQLQPVGSVAHIQICGTTTCMICGAEDLMAVCKKKIAAKPHEISADGKFSWEEVECLGACANAPMAQIGKDYYEDLTATRFAEMIDEMAAGKVPVPGPQNGRYAAEPLEGLTSLTDFESGKQQYNVSAQLAVDIGDSIKRIDGTEVPLLTPWLNSGGDTAVAERLVEVAPAPEPEAETAQIPEATPEPAPVVASDEAERPAGLEGARDGTADDLKKIKGVGPKMEKLLNSMGFFHFDQVAGWTAAEVAWVDDNLEGFKGRVSRDNWVEQAKLLAGGGETEFSKKVDDGDVY
ncbi:MAG: NADH-quinone oxidoreductase subunit NuoE [Boseongicola sp.]|nr:MAG: NADH-quinone oxidoreductase subunit NuoE [Boseongicola sp.]